MLKNQIRLATLSDAATLAALHIDTWREAYKNQLDEQILNNLSLCERTKMWQELIKKSVTILVLEEENDIIGFASLCGLRDESLNLQNCGEISSLYCKQENGDKG